MFQFLECFQDLCAAIPDSVPCGTRRTAKIGGVLIFRSNFHVINTSLGLAGLMLLQIHFYRQFLFYFFLLRYSLTNRSRKSQIKADAVKAHLTELR